MLVQESRPFTDEELDKLHTWLNQPAPGRAVWATGCTEWILVYFVAFSTALFVGVYLEAALNRRGLLLLSFAVAMLLCVLAIGALNRIRCRRSQAQWENARKTLQEDLSDGHAHLIRATVRDCVLINYREDFGWGWFLDVGEGQLLYINGLVLDELRFELTAPDDRGAELSFEDRHHDFPNTSIDVVRAPSGHLIDVRCLGEYLEPSQEVNLAESPEFDLAYHALPSHGHLFPGSLETLSEDLRNEIERLTPRPT